MIEITEEEIKKEKERVGNEIIGILEKLGAAQTKENIALVAAYTMKVYKEAIKDSQDAVFRGMNR